MTERIRPVESSQPIASSPVYITKKKKSHNGHLTCNYEMAVILCDGTGVVRTLCGFTEHRDFKYVDGELILRRRLTDTNTTMW